MNRTFTVGILSLTFHAVLVGQNLIVKHFGPSDSIKAYQPNSLVVEVIQGNKIIASSSVTPAEETRVIVELTAPAKLKKGGNGADAAQQRQRVRSEILSLAPTAVVSHEYSDVINAISLTARRDEVEKMRKIPGVKQIHEDKTISAFGDVNGLSPQAVRGGGLRATGRGVKVGILDTGIDYLHEAFGGGFGPGHAVMGGYDFVNNDADPYDDNGHGTHVAGIIAGRSGEISGIAADASLYAYKVLDAAGTGYSSNVIAGIEQAIKDGIAVLNISLGSPAGDSEDLLSLAVDRAAASGIVAVVAAGNGGDFGTIGSPGSAESALTVGAIDAQGNIAPFSSKGPAERAYGLKPEIVAPGVGIISAKLGGGYLPMSGTSMAAPFVTGVAAALRELHPEWNAFQIRSAVIESSRDLHQPVFAQGNGRIDTSIVFGKSNIALPPTFSFGIVPSSTTEWKREDTLRFFNHSSATRNYSLKHQSIHEGITLTFSPPVITVPPGGSAAVNLQLVIDNGIVPNNASWSNGYSGKIVATSAEDSVVIPYVFFKGPLLQLSFGETPWQVLIHDRREKAYSFNPKGPYLSSVLPAGTYDIMVSFLNGSHVVRENISTITENRISVDKEEALHTVTIVPRDENGQILGAVSSGNSFSYIEAFLHAPSGMGQVFLGGGRMQSANMTQVRNFSSASANYRFGYALNLQYGSTKSYTFDVELDSGISSSWNFTFDPSDLKHINFRYSVDSTLPRIFPITWSVLAQRGNVVGVSFYNGSDAPLTYPFIQSSFYTRRNSSGFPILHYREAYKY